MKRLLLPSLLFLLIIGSCDVAYLPCNDTLDLGFEFYREDPNGFLVPTTADFDSVTTAGLNRPFYPKDSVATAIFNTNEPLPGVLAFQFWKDSVVERRIEMRVETRELSRDPELTPCNNSYFEVTGSTITGSDFDSTWLPAPAEVSDHLTIYVIP